MSDGSPRGCWRFPGGGSSDSASHCDGLKKPGICSEQTDRFALSIHPRGVNKVMKSIGVISIAADDRERPSGIPDLLAKSEGVLIEVKRLPIADYLVADRILIERKSVLDFVVSIIDGRLFRQAITLSAAPFRSILIIEGDESSFTKRHVRKEAIHGAYVCLAAVFGLPVIRTRDAAETASTIIACASQTIRERRRTFVKKANRRTGERKRQILILQSLPGIGAAKAERLLNVFGSVKKAVSADEQDLVAIPGFGPAIAAKIVSAVG